MHRLLTALLAGLFLVWASGCGPKVENSYPTNPAGPPTNKPVKAGPAPGGGQDNKGSGAMAQ
jgi:hypothetical protein